MKIVRIIARLNVGGPARHVIWLSKELQNAEDQTVLIAGTVPEGEEDMGWFADENGVTPLFIEQMTRELSPKDIVSLWKVFCSIWREKPDVIHTHTAKAGTIGRIAGLLYKILSRKKVSIIHTFHGHIFHSYYSGAKTRIFLVIEKILARLATDKIIVISEKQFEEIHQEFAIGKREQFTVIPLGIDLEIFSNPENHRQTFRREIGADDNETIVGFVGRLTEIKNIQMLINVAQLVKESDRSNLRFVIIGDGNLRAELESAAKELGSMVSFLGNRTDAEVFYPGLDIVALTSLNEGTPLSLIEAMANGVPVISTNVGGVGDLLGETVSPENGYSIHERGISTESNDAEGFCAGLLHLAADRNLQKELSESGKAFVRNNYSKERLVEDIRKLYRSL